MTSEQLSLLPDPNMQLPPLKVDVDKIAAHIAAHAPKKPYAEQEIRKERAAGLRPGLREVNAIPRVPIQSDGIESDAVEGGINPQYHRPPEHLSPEEKARGVAGVTAARIALEQAQKDSGASKGL